MKIHYEPIRLPLFLLSLFVMAIAASGCEWIVDAYLDNSGFPDEVKFDAAGGTKIVSSEKDDCMIVSIALRKWDEEDNVRAQQDDDLKLYVVNDWVTAHEIDNHSIEVSVLPNSSVNTRKMSMTVHSGNIRNVIVITQSK